MIVLRNQRRLIILSCTLLLLAMVGAKEVTLQVRNLRNIRYLTRLYIGQGAMRTGLRTSISLHTPCIVVPNSVCDSCNTGRKYDCEKSDSCKLSVKNLELRTEAGSFRVDSFEDMISFDKTDVQAFPVKGFIARARLAPDALGGLQEGILGFGPSSELCTSFLDTLKQKGLIDERIFSIFLGDSPTSTLVIDSSLTIGAVNTSVIKNKDEPITYLPTLKTAWEIEISSLAVNDMVAEDKVKKAEFSFDTEAIHLPWHAVGHFVGEAQKNGIFCQPQDNGHLCNCHSYNIAKLPTIKVTLVTGSVFSIEPRAYAMMLGGNCMALISKGKGLLDLDSFVIGLPFFRKYLTIFDMEKSRIGYVESIDHTYKEPNLEVVLYPVLLGILLVAIGVAKFFMISA